MDRPEQVIQLLSPTPFLLNGEAYDGNSQKLASVCKNCEARDCISSTVVEGDHNVCGQGMSYYATTVMGVPITLGGVLVTDRNFKVSGARRKDLNRLWRTHKEMLKTLSLLGKAQSVFEHEMNSAASDTTSFLHDVRTSLTLVISSCEKLISKSPGYNFGAKLKSSDPDMLRLHQSINLLTEQLGLVDIISNPEKIVFGTPNLCDVYSFVYKITQLFEPRANARGMKIIMERGEFVDVKVRLYNSFQLVPLILLENAIKYGSSHSDIHVEFKEGDDGLVIKFKSVGDHVPEDYREAIFQRRVRAPSSHKMSSEGSGLGLYIAKLVVEAHKCYIDYEADNILGEPVNCFNVFIPGQLY